MKTLFFSFLVFLELLSLSLVSCRRPDVPDFEHAGGYVIGKETCKANPDDDEWLIDLSYELNPPSLNYGDTITINGTLYKHMVKTSQLLPKFRIIGQKVSFDFHLSSGRVQSVGCMVTVPFTYYLREMNVIASGEIR